MQYACLMRGSQAIRNAGQQFGDLFRCPLLFFRPVFQRPAVDAFHNKILSSLEFSDVVHGDNVGMIQRGGHLRFPLKTAPGLRVSKIIG